MAQLGVEQSLATADRHQLGDRQLELGFQRSPDPLRFSARFSLLESGQFNLHAGVLAAIGAEEKRRTDLGTAVRTRAQSEIFIFLRVAPFYYLFILPAFGPVFKLFSSVYRQRM